MALLAVQSFQTPSFFLFHPTMDNWYLLRNGASLSNYVVNSGLSPGSSGLPQEFASHETVAVRIAKTWDSPRAGTVPVLLPSTLILAPFYLLRTIALILLGGCRCYPYFKSNWSRSRRASFRSDVFSCWGITGNIFRLENPAP
jgi:hypothetical protein